MKTCWQKIRNGLSLLCLPQLSSAQKTTPKTSKEMDGSLHWFSFYKMSLWEDSNNTKVASEWENFFLTLRQDGHRFLQVLSHFRGFEPHLRRYFFSEILFQMDFFLHFDILERLRQPQNSKICIRNEQNRDRHLFMYVASCSIHFKKLNICFKR